MPDFIIGERLELIREHIDVILERMKKISTSQDFIASEDGQLIYDSLLIRLQSIGENIKKIESIEDGFTEQHLHLDPRPIIRFRDIASHHYELMDYQVIFGICNKNIGELDFALRQYEERKNKNS